MPPPNDQYLRESVIEAMDGSDAALFPYLPYIFQDLWEIGSSPDVIMDLIRKHAKADTFSLRVLDLGCGKGAVSIPLTRDLGCTCLGIDGVSEFIDDALAKAREHDVEAHCDFRVGDVHDVLAELDQADKKFHVVVLGAVGPILGDYSETFVACANRLEPGGLVIVDDGYIPDESDFKHAPLLKRTIFMGYAKQAGLDLLDEVVESPEELKTADAEDFALIEKRCRELMAEYPGDAKLFEEYIRDQKREYEMMETKLVCSTMVFGRQ